MINLQSPLPGLHLRRQRPAAAPVRGFLTVRRTGAIGDALAATVVVKKLQNLGFSVIYQAGAPCHCVLRRVPVVKSLAEPNGRAIINLDGAYEDNPNRRQLHFAEMFVGAANRQLNGIATIADTRNFAPRMVLSQQDVDAAMGLFSLHAQPWVVICPRSNSWPHRTVPDRVWADAAAKIQGTCFWIGTHPAPRHSGIVDLGLRHLDTVVGAIGVADLLVTVDTGPLHIACAVGTPAVVIEQSSSPKHHVSDQRDWTMIAPPLDCLDCQDNACRFNSQFPPCQNIDPHLIAIAANSRLWAVTDNGVSAVIVIHRPSATRLNKCIKHVLEQVDEIVVVSDSAGQVPDGASRHEKVRYVAMQGDLGYGKKANRGCREANHRWLLMLNDDVFLSPDAVDKMAHCVEWDVGMIGMEMRYPNGTIQHAGKHRPPGHQGWGHTDHAQMVSRHKEPLEMENVCGASVLIRREALFQAGGWDEDVWLYGEDDLLCLRFRQAGWRIMYTPHAKAEHIEHASTGVLNLGEQCRKSDAIVRAKWGWWFELNRNNQGLGVFE